MKKSIELEYEWVRNDNAIPDIAIKSELIETSGKTVEEVLESIATSYGGKPERTVSIIKEGNLIARWERRLKQ